MSIHKIGTYAASCNFLHVNNLLQNKRMKGNFVIIVANIGNHRLSPYNARYKYDFHS